MAIGQLSICNMSHVNCDTIFVDTRTNRVAFFSIVSHSTLLRASIKKINEEAKPYAYMKGFGTLRLDKNGYNIEQKKQSDGDYLHAVGYLKDVIDDKNSGISTLMSYIYYKDDVDRNNKIYDKIYSSFAIPMLPEWKDYIIEKLLESKNLYHLEYKTSHDPLPFRCMGLYVADSKIESIITEGLKNGDINVEGSNEPSMLIDSITGLDSYLNVFGETLASKIQQSFTPKFIPGEQPYTEYVDNYDDNIFGTGIEMYEAQKSTVQAAVNCLDKEDVTFVIGEMGSGKTLQGAGITYAHHKDKDGRGLNSIVLCPGHLKDKWKREIENFVPNSRAFIIKSITDIIDLESRLRNKKKVENTYVIISKEDAKISYEKRPAAIWNNIHRSYVCPECGKILKKKVKKYMIPFDRYDMMTQLAHNKKCNNTVKKWNNQKRTYEEVICGTDLWVPLNKESKDEKWIKLGADGWIQRDQLYYIRQELELKQELLTIDKKQKSILKRVTEITDAMNEGTYKEISRGTRRYSVAKYIKDHMNRLFDYVIVD